jgi:ABC-2 type transport system ATP-binding protein
MNAMIELRGVRKIYRPRGEPAAAALRDVDLTVAPGQTVAVLGAPGAGKTTMIRLLGGLLKATAGAIRLGGHDLGIQRAAALRQVGVLPADAALPRSRTVQQHLMQVGRALGLAPAVLDTFVESLLHDTSLWASRNTSIRALPPGQRRMVALTSALIAGPPIVLLDEPTRGLDEAEARAALAAIRQATRGKTVVLATSRLSIACDLCERIVMLEQGRVVGERMRGELLGLLRQERYTIRVKGHLGAAWSEWFDGLNVVNEQGGEGVISGPIADQSALHGVLARIHALNLPLLNVSRAEPSLEDVFVQL